MLIYCTVTSSRVGWATPPEALPMHSATCSIKFTVFYLFHCVTQSLLSINWLIDWLIDWLIGVIFLRRLAFVFLPNNCLFLTAFIVSSRSILTPRKWPKVAKSGQKWPKVAKRGQKWSKVVKSGQKWPNVVKSGQKWPNVVKSGQKWPNVVKSGQKWSKVAKSGQKWPKVARILRRFKESKLSMGKNHRGMS